LRHRRPIPRPAALAALVALALTAAGAGPAQKPASLFVSPGGSDAGACTRATPCRSFDRAYHRARAGQVVEVAGGTYPSQSLSAAPGKSSSAHVVFRPAPGGTVTMGGRLTLRGVTHLTLTGFRFPRSDPDFELLLDGCNTDVSLVNSSGRRFFILEGNSQITFAGGSWGGYGTPGDEDSAIGTAGPSGPERSCGGKPAGPARQIVFDHVTFHDVFWNVPDTNWGGSHPDCFEINGYVDGVTIRNSTFTRCGNTFLSIYTDQGPVRNVVVANDTFTDLGDDSWYGMQIKNTQPFPISGVVLRDNTYRPDNPHAYGPYSPIRTEADPLGGTPMQVTGNSFQRGPSASECAKYRGAPYRVSWTSNQFLLGRRCGS